MKRLTLQHSGIALLALLALGAAVGPAMVGLDPAAQQLSRSLLPPSAADPLGTDLFGRSVLARLAQAGQLSLQLALLSALTALAVGCSLGVVAAWRGGVVARGLAMLADAAQATPGLLLVLLCAALAPGQLWALYLGLALAQWVECFRVARTVAQPVLGGPAVEAARLLDLGPWHVARHHLLPALAPVAGRLLPLNSAQAVLSLAALGFIGVGPQPPRAELGLLMTEALPHYAEAPWLLAAPVGLLALLVMGLWLSQIREENAHDPR
jgi:peptide/nickel transport system permease protein